MNKKIQSIIERIEKTTPPLQAGFQINKSRNWAAQITGELTQQLKLVVSSPGRVLAKRGAGFEAQKAANDAALHYFLDKKYSAGAAICQGIYDGQKIQRIFDAVGEFSIPCMIVSRFK